MRDEGLHCKTLGVVACDATECVVTVYTALSEQKNECLYSEHTKNLMRNSSCSPWSSLFLDLQFDCCFSFGDWCSSHQPVQEDATSEGVARNNSSYRFIIVQDVL